MTAFFVVGGEYLDRLGEYVVTAIEGSEIAYRYADGSEGRGPIELKARIHRNIVEDQAVAHPFVKKEYFQTLGFMAEVADFQAEVPPQSQPGFEREYARLTGTTPRLNEDKYYGIEVQHRDDKWGSELRIYLPAGRDLTLPPGIEVRAGWSLDTVRINNNTLWWQLIRIGFRLGIAHERAMIRATVPPEYRKDFDAGGGW